MKRLAKIGLGIGIIVLGILLFVVMGNKKDVKIPEKETEYPIVSTRVIRPEPISYTLEVTGILEAKNKVEIYSEVQGILLPTNTPFKEGNTFTKGQTLLRIDNREYVAQLQSNKSGLISQIAAMLPDMEIEFPEASQKWEAYLRKFDMDGPLKNLPETTSDKEKLFVTGKGIFQTYYNVKNQQERASKYTIRAPFSGSVTESNVNVGTLVRSGQKLGEFADSSVFELTLAIPASANKYVGRGKSVQLVTLDGSQRLTGKISRINDKINQTTQTTGAIVEVSGRALKDGQYLKAEVEGSTIDEAVRIKANLMLENNHAYIVKDSTLVLQKVLPINYEQDDVVITGLESGMILLDEVLANAYPGMKVNY